MDMKNTFLLLILLLSILGLIIGVHYTVDESSDASQGNEISIKSDSPSIISYLEKQGNEPNLINEILYSK